MILPRITRIARIKEIIIRIIRVIRGNLSSDGISFPIRLSAGKFVALFVSRHLGLHGCQDQQQTSG